MGQVNRKGPLGTSALVLAIAVLPCTAAYADPSPQAGSASTSPVASPASTPSAEAIAEAKTRYQRGLDFLKEGSYELASVELQRAYALAANYKILYNLGLVQMQLTDYASAVRSFEGYLAEGGADVPADRRAEVKRHLEFLAARVARVDVSVNTKDAEVTIDDLSVGKAPLPAPVVVNAGRRKIVASHEGMEPVVQVVTVGAGETLRLTLVLNGTRRADGAVAAAASPAEGAAPAAKQGVPWVPWAITGVLAAGAGIAGGIAIGASSSLQDAKAAPDPDPQKLQDLEGQAKVSALVADVLIASSVVAGGVALYFTFKKHDPEKPPVRVGFTGTGVQLGGRF